MQRPKPPHVALMELCREIAGSAVWALGMGVNDLGERQWEVYCEDEELAKQLPEEYGGNQIHVIVAPRPTQEDVQEAKRREKEAEAREKKRGLKNIWSSKKRNNKKQN